MRERWQQYKTTYFVTRFLLDTGVFISYFGRENEFRRTDIAKYLIDHIHSIGGIIFYSQRTYNELRKKDWGQREQFLEKCTLGSYHFGNETFGEIEGTWENIGSRLNNDSDGEYQLSEQLNQYLRKDRDIRDRGILLDAIKNECQYFIHENPNDFDRVPQEITDDFNLIVLNLLNIDKNLIKTLIK